MIKALIPKEEKYFEDFRDIITHILQMAQLTHQLFAADVVEDEVFLKIKPLENRCDEISDKVVKRLNKTYITPFDREDIFSLIKKLDDISDILFGVVVRIETFAITSKIKHADKLSSIVLQQIKELGTAINDLKVKSVNECKAVKDLETEADKIYQQAMKELFSQEKDAITLIKTKEILDLLEDASDKCQSAANVILTIFIKNA